MRGTIHLAVVLWGLVAIGAQAQEALFDGGSLKQSCLAGQCVNATTSSLRGLQARRLEPDAFNSQVALVASVLFSAAQKADDTALEQIAQALRLLAMYSSDDAQIASLLQLARDVAAGKGKLFDLASPFAVSPS